MHRRTARGLVAAALVMTSGMVFSASAFPAGAPDPLLPDLDQQTPTSLQIARTDIGGPAHYALGFQSAVRNVGEGPLLIDGRRASTRTPFMVARQVVQNRDGSLTSGRAAGRLRYAVALGHHHWHYLGFDRYELRRAGGDHTLLRDHKSGFCLGDRYRVADAVVPDVAPAVPRYTGSCGLYTPQRLSVSEGISVGYGDNYVPYLEGQSLPLTGLVAGRYVLVHRVNEDRRLRETRYDNDAASVLLELRWHDGVPSIATLATCPDTARCDGSTDAAGPPRAAAADVPLVARAPLDGRQRLALCRLPAFGDRPT